MIIDDNIENIENAEMRAGLGERFHGGGARCCREFSMIIDDNIENMENAEMRAGWGEVAWRRCAVLPRIIDDYQ